MWTYPQVKAALALLSPAPADAVAAAAALNAQPTTLPLQAVQVSDVHGVLLLSGEWLAVQALAGQTPSAAFLTPEATASDQAIAAARLAEELAESQVKTIDPSKWAGFFADLSALNAAGVIGSASMAEIQALATPTVPTWQPELYDQDILKAEALS